MVYCINFEQNTEMFKSINPFNSSILEEYEHHNKSAVEKIILKTHEAFLIWKSVSLEERSGLLLKLSTSLKKNKQKLGTLITSEMGKVLKESISEIEKCAWLCEYYAQNSDGMLDTESAPSDGTVSYIRFEPVGIIYAIMPWNFPFWQVFRFAIPTLLAGNTIILKHAPNVIGSAKAIEKLFKEAGFPDNVFSNIVIPVNFSENVIAHPLVQGVTLTGSQAAGRIVASQAGKYLKKTVLELGGSDPYIILADADFDEACEVSVSSRMLNSGQVCIAAKRFIVEESIVDQFIKDHKTRLENLKMGDPMNMKTDIGPIARTDLLETIDEQVKKSIEMGASLETGGKSYNKIFYTPTLLTDVKKGMPVYDEETFGPVSVVITAKNAEHALQIANDSPFGLGASIWTRDLELAEKMAENIEAGAVFINGMTKSDPRLPFGGIKQSGYGRELSHYGVKEFMNVKTIWVK